MLSHLLSRVRVAGPGRALELEFGAGALDGGQRQGHEPGVRVAHRCGAALDSFEDAVELPPAIDGLVCPDAHPLADRTDEVLRPHQRSVQPGRRALQVVSARNRVVGVQDIAELAATCPPARRA